MSGFDDTELRPASTLPDREDEEQPATPSAIESVQLAKLHQAERDREFTLDVRRGKAAAAAALFGDPIAAIKIGRFAIVRKLGAGGMGVVYVAYDEQLDRRVAVKLLRGAASAEAQLRFEREAQAMARLSHPHVVTVHEVGKHEGETFVAMEFVDGQDLRAWLAEARERQRGWPAIVEMFRQAGEGLAAAHEAGIIHRDFKPDNVLVGKDGRARVADFGLAHGFGEALELPEPPPGDRSEDSQRRLDTELTRTGALMGTPAYMAPEQFGGRRTDARGDQFSFCVALWEALYRQRPFSGANLLELSLAISEGRITAPPLDSEVPSWLRAILVRGLARKPQDRWPSMRALLDAIGNDPSVRRRRIAARVGLGLGALALVGVGYLALTQLRHAARARYWNALTEDLLEIERERGLAQAQDEAMRARDATRMAVVGNYTPAANARERDDPAVAAAILREVEGEARRSSAWLSVANAVLGRPLSWAVLQGHRAPLGPLVFSPDGEWLYSGADDGEVRRWRIADGSSEVITRHEGVVTELALSHDGRWLASSSRDGTVQLWSSTTGELRELARHAQPVYSVVFDRDGRQLATASFDGSVRVHGLRTGTVQAFDAGSVVNVVDFDPSGTRLLLGGNDNKARVWRIGDAQPSHVLEGHTQPLFFARWVADERVVTAADDGTARLWQLDSASPSDQIVAEHERPIAALDVHGTSLVTGALDGSMTVTSLVAPHVGHPLPPHADEVWSVRFTPDGQAVVSASFDKTARLTRSDGRTSPKVFEGHHTSVYRVALDQSGRWLATGSYDTDIRIWDTQRPVLATPLRGHTTTAFSIEVDAGGNRAVSASHDGTARVWSLDDGAELALLDGRGESGSALSHAVFSPRGDRVATAKFNGNVELWRLADLSATTLQGHTRAAFRVTFDHAGRRVASASEDGTARVWDVETGALELVANGHDDQVWAVLFDAGDRRLVTASWDATVRVWDLERDAQIAVLRGHSARINCAVESPNGHWWATGSDDATARLWPADLRGDPIVLAGHEKSVWALVFDGPGERIATVAHDGHVRIWRVTDGVLLDTIDTGEGSRWDAEFLADDRLATAASDGTVRVWSLRDRSQPPLLLTAHATDVQSTAVGMAGHKLVSAAIDGSVVLWDIDTLRTDSAALVEQLFAATRWCLSAEQRGRELGEAPEVARAAAEACASHPSP